MCPPVAAARASRAENVRAVALEHAVGRQQREQGIGTGSGGDDRVRGQGRFERMLGGAALDLLARGNAQLGVASRPQPGWPRGPASRSSSPASTSSPRATSAASRSSSPCGAIVPSVSGHAAVVSAARTIDGASPPARRRRRVSASLGSAVARRRGIEHDAAGDRGLGRGRADDHAVAACGRDRLAQPQLREPGGAGSQRLALEQRDARLDAGRADQHLREHPVPHARPACQRLQLDVESEALGKGARGRQRRPARDGAALDAGEAGRDALACLRALDRLVVDLDRAHPHLAGARQHGEPVARGDRTRPQRPRDDRADPVQREGAVDRQARSPGHEPGRDRVGGLFERLAQLVETRARARGGLDDRRTGEGRALEQLLDVGARQVGALGIDQIALAERDHRAAHGEQLEDRDVLARLRHDAVVAGDHEQGEVDPGRAGDHRAHEALVAGHVDDREHAAGGQRQARVAEGDRDAALALFGQAVGVDARERAHEGRLAVIDVPGRAQCARGRPGHVDAGARMRAASASVSVRQSSTSAPSETRASTAGSSSRRRAASRSASPSSRTPKDSSSASGRAPPPTRATVSTTLPPMRAASASARARTSAAGSVTARRTGSSARAARGIAIDAQRGLEGGQRELVDAQCARQRVPATGSDRVGAPGQDAGLRTAEQLVAREADQIAAVAQRVSRERLARQLRGLEQRARADVVDQRERRRRARSRRARAPRPRP